MNVSLGFIPIIDDILSDSGNLQCAYIYGFLMVSMTEDRHVSVSQATIADRSGITRQTVNKWLLWLVSHGYLDDLTPELNGQAHVYRMTEKANIRVAISLHNLSKISQVPVKQFDRVPVKKFDSLNVLAVKFADTMNHDVMMHDDLLKKVQVDWSEIGLDDRALKPILNKIDDQQLVSFSRLVEEWRLAVAGDLVPENWGPGLIYSKIKDGELPPEPVKTFGDEVRELQEYWQEYHQID